MMILNSVGLYAVIFMILTQIWQAFLVLSLFTMAVYVKPKITLTYESELLWLATTKECAESNKWVFLG